MQHRLSKNSLAPSGRGLRPQAVGERASRRHEGFGQRRGSLPPALRATAPPLAQAPPPPYRGSLSPRGRFFDTQSKRKFAGVLITEYFIWALTFVGAFSIETEYILHITVNSKTVDELAELYNFTSYGNQVLLDNGAGLSTRYAHMTQTAVTAGEAVTAGQVIGYVGNTGDSTGFHLHFEVMQNGVRVNPMDMVSVR